MCPGTDLACHYKDVMTDLTSVALHEAMLLSERELLEFCQQNGIVFQAFAALVIVIVQKLS
jgi:diketogulonate reductase-like aldo/keto reductase